MHTPEHRADKQVEAQAHRFAGAFLMPRDGIFDELPVSHRDVRHLLYLKQKWGASIAAILRRARDLGRMSPDAYTSAMKAISARGWRRDEPGNLRPEEPSLLRQVVEVASEAGHDTDELARQAKLTPTFVHELISEASDVRRPVDL